MVLQTTTPRGVSQQGAEKEPAGSDTHSAVFNPDSTIPLHSVQIPKLPDALAAADTLPPPTVPSVSFSKLFRYATRLELFLNFVGLLCAAAAGSAQVWPEFLTSRHKMSNCRVPADDVPSLR